MDPHQKRTFWLITEKLFFCIYWYLFLFFFVIFVFFLICFFGGFKGQVRWPKRPPHLGLSPPYFMFFCSFLSLLLIHKDLVFPPKKGHFLLLSVYFCFSLAFACLPLFHFLVLCHSLVSFLSFFLLVFLFCFLLVPSFCLFLCFSLFFAFFHDKKNSCSHGIAADRLSRLSILTLSSAALAAAVARAASTQTGQWYRCDGKVVYMTVW